MAKIEILVNKDTGDTIVGEVEQLASHLLKHKGCWGFMKKTSPSKTHDRFSCDGCNWSFTVPKTITTLTRAKEEVEKHGYLQSP